VAAIAAIVPTIGVDLQLSDLLVAKIIPYYLIPYGIGALIYAPLTRYVSYRIVFISTMALYGVCCYFCVSTNLNQILLGRAGMGIAGSSAIPLGLMLIGELFSKKIRGRLVGVFFSCAFIASIAGLIAAGTVHWKWLFYIPSGCGGILAIVYLNVLPGLIDQKHKGHINYLRVFKDIRIAKVFCFIFIISFLYHGVHKWYGVYLSQVYHFDKLTISLFFILTVVGGMIGQLTGGILSDKKGRIPTCFIGIIGLAISIILLYGIYSKIVLGIILILISMFWTVGHNGVSTILTDFSHMDRPIIASLNSSVRFISGGLGFMLSSLFVKESFSITFLVIGMLTFIMMFTIKKLLPQIG